MDRGQAHYYLVGENCGFYKRKNQLFPKMKLEEVRIELENQIKTFLKTGMELTHLDSHHHIHMYDGVREIIADLAKVYRVPLRHPDYRTKQYLLDDNIVTTDYFSMDFYGERANYKISITTENTANESMSMASKINTYFKNMEEINNMVQDLKKEAEALAEKMKGLNV